MSGAEMTAAVAALFWMKLRREIASDPGLSFFIDASALCIERELASPARYRKRTGRRDRSKTLVCSLRAPMRTSRLSSTLDIPILPMVRRASAAGLDTDLSPVATTVNKHR